MTTEQSILLGKFEKSRGYSSDRFDADDWFGFDKFENGYNLAKKELASDSNKKSNSDTEWKYTIDELPITYQEGYWDGKKSDEILVEDTEGQNFVAVLYSGFMDGSEFNNWYECHCDFELANIVRWMEIPE